MGRATCGKVIICCAKLATEAEEAGLPSTAAQVRQVDALIQLNLELTLSGNEAVYTDDEVVKLIALAEDEIQKVRRWKAAAQDLQDDFADRLAKIIQPDPPGPRA